VTRVRAGYLSLVPVGLFVYALAYDNANSFPDVRGWEWTRLTTLPPSLRIGEVAVVGALVVLALSRGLTRFTTWAALAGAGFLSLGLLSQALYRSAPLFDAFRLHYMWLLPACVFIIGRDLPWPPVASTWVSRIFNAWMLASVVVSWVQYAVLEYPVGDDITGLNRDAHVNGAMMLFAALQWLSDGLVRRSWKSFGIAAVLLATMILSSVLKVLAFGILAIGLLFYFQWRDKQGHLANRLAHAAGWTLACSLGLAAWLSVFAQYDTISSNRIRDVWDKLVSNPTSFGPIPAHKLAYDLITQQVSSSVLGRGPFSVANPMSVGRVDGQFSSGLRADLLALRNESGEDALVTLTSSLLAEYGILAFGCVTLMYAAIGREVWRATKHPNLSISTRARGVAASGTVFALVVAASLFGSLDALSLTWCLMLPAGLLCREPARLRARVPLHR